MFTGSSPSYGFYTMNDAVLELNNSFNDLGIIFSCELDFGNHITSTVSKTTCILGFQSHPILEYESVIWDPQYAVRSNKIESIQMQINIFCFRYLGNCWDPNKTFSTHWLFKKADVRILNAVFLLKLINGVINFQFFLEKLYRRVAIRPTRY